MRVAIFAEVNDTQLSFIRRFLLNEFGTNYNMVVEGDNSTTLVQTPLTGEMLNDIASETGKTVLEVATLATNWGIKTVQQALEHEDVPEKVKDILYGYL